MQIVLNERKNGKMLDSIEYILNIDKKNFNNILKTLITTNKELDFSYKYEIDNPNITQEIFNVSSFLKEISEIEKELINKKQKYRVNKLLKCRTNKILKKQISKDYNLNKSDVEEIFNVLEGKQPFSEFINNKKMESNEKTQKRNLFPFTNFRKDKMLPEGKNDIIDYYYYYIMQELNYGKYSFNYFIPKKQEYKDRLNLIRNKITAEKYIEGYSTIIEENDEQDWKISDELKEYVYKDIPENLSSEQEAVWIYLKLCETLHYDDKRVFQNNDNKIDVNLLENVKPNSKVICFDFARIYANFIKNMPNKDIEVKIIGGSKHFLIALVSKNIVATIEATSIMSNTNEFYKVKMGLPIEGISVLFDEQNIINNAINEFTPLIYENMQTMDNYIDMLGSIRKDEETNKDETNKDETNKDKLFDKLDSLVKTMKQRNVSGVEAITGVINFSSLGFLGDDIEKSWIKNEIDYNEYTKYESHLIINKKDEKENFYILNSTNMTITTLSKEDLIGNFKSGKYSYKSNDHTIKSLKDELLHDEEEVIEK